MDKFALILRKSRAPNIFRKVILRSFNSMQLEEMLLCSGFVQEGTKTKSSFYSSRHFRRFAPIWPCGKRITTVGVYNHLWKPQYDNFAAALSNIQCGCGKYLNVTKLSAPYKNKWHAKVFIGKTNGSPSIGVIGSSNLTRPAFGQNDKWNSEADVILWNSSIASVDSIVSRAIGFSTGRFEGDAPFQSPSNVPSMGNEIIVGNYDEEDPRNRGESLSYKLDRLWNEIVAATSTS